jgi:hypothetical protein
LQQGSTAEKNAGATAAGEKAAVERLTAGKQRIARATAGTATVEVLAAEKDAGATAAGEKVALGRLTAGKQILLEVQHGQQLYST